MYVTYNSNCEFGAPEINPKRPYGNSNVIGDIASILGIEPDVITDYGKEFSDLLVSKLENIHLEMEIVLQIVLNTLSFVPGNYVAENYHDWKLI